ncbi:MAG: 4Fe-4S dicluster domain-containing protein [Candidatus Promineifilaceae bacterium]|nr:4Fe-4S dicluster domain-containing protein [Candidatus Promineifilaceae bacterium]
MDTQIPAPGKQVVIAKKALQTLFDALRSAGYQIVGPTIRQEAIVYDEIERIEDLPVGWTDEHAAGAYRLRRRDDGLYFGYVVGPDSWKKYLYPSRQKLFNYNRLSDGDGRADDHNNNGDGPFAVETGQETQKAPRYAFVGVRGCELAAINVQDHIFLDGRYQELHYKARRERAFLLGVNCTEPGETCFCASMGTGPRCNAECDLVLTELDDSFLVEVGSELGAEMLADCQWHAAGAFESKQARRLLAEAETQMGRTLETGDLPDLLYDNLDHPRWDDVAERCLSCTNCTMVCPTCFCHTVEDASDLTGRHTERVRVWDSCFNPDFSHVYGGNLRPNVRARYRQWLTHKLASWIDQFGMSGCVGCGRCITWCPAAIDLTEEVTAIRTAAEPENVQ